MPKRISNSDDHVPKRRKTDSIQHEAPQPAQEYHSQSTIYQPLDKAKREIRICDLKPALQISDKLECSLRIVPIKTAGRFVAFSYVWGKDAETDSIYVDSVEIRIKPNLAAALRQFRTRNHQDARLRIRRISVWIDAICINQSSVEERNHQVPLMKSIYSGCANTFSWLGEASQDSDFAMDCIDKIASVKRPRDHKADVRERVLDMFPDSAPWVAILNLLQRDFWYRVWIFQELMLPSNLILACGSKSVPWKSFRELENIRGCWDELQCDAREIRLLSAHMDSETQDKVVAVFKRLQELYIVLSRENINEMSTIGSEPTDLLAQTLHLQASDLRDKIYGILALQKTLDIRPDYSKCVQQVYTDIAASILAVKSQILEFSGIHFEPNVDDLQTTPSWVPDWGYISQNLTSTKTSTIRQIDCTRYSGPMQGCFEELPHFTALHIRGQIWEEIIVPMPAEEWQNSQDFSVMMRDLHGLFYPPPKKTIDQSKPLPVLIALYFTLIRRGVSYNPFQPTRDKQYTNLAAGFCVTIIHRINDASVFREASEKLSLSALFQTFADYSEIWKEMPDAPETHKDIYLAAEKENTEGRLFFKCSSGHFGLGPLGAKTGDLLCMLYGATCPYVLRKIDEHYIIIGSCWMLDFMEFEEEDESQSVMFEIW